MAVDTSKLAQGVYNFWADKLRLTPFYQSGEEIGDPLESNHIRTGLSIKGRRVLFKSPSRDVYIFSFDSSDSGLYFSELRDLEEPIPDNLREEFVQGLEKYLSSLETPETILKPFEVSYVKESFRKEKHEGISVSVPLKNVSDGKSFFSDWKKSVFNNINGFYDGDF